MDLWLWLALFCFTTPLIGGLIWGYLEKKSEAHELRNSKALGTSATERRSNSEDPTIPFG